ncbi:MAG: hypothetical protein ACLU6W_16550, partial [Lachnospiraceae bacterium]
EKVRSLRPSGFSLQNFSLSMSFAIAYIKISNRVLFSGHPSVSSPYPPLPNRDDTDSVPAHPRL